MRCIVYSDGLEYSERDTFTYIYGEYLDKFNHHTVERVGTPDNSSDSITRYTFDTVEFNSFNEYASFINGLGAYTSKRCDKSLDEENRDIFIDYDLVEADCVVAIPIDNLLGKSLMYELTGEKITVSYTIENDTDPDKKPFDAVLMIDDRCYV